MSDVPARYPVDRYLVESSKKFEMVNIIDDDLWNSEPALKPEDELILRKLHEMLQSTADDLKLLSGELSKFHQSGVQVKTVPIPLDEEFNEKVHIEEIVNAKFHGYKIIDISSSCVPETKPRNAAVDIVKLTPSTQNLKMNNTNRHMNTTSILKKPIKRNLGVSRTKVIQINANQDSIKTEKLNNGKIINTPSVVYNEFSYKYIEPKLNTLNKVLEVQEMPRINIRSELKKQKVLQLDIMPEMNETSKSNAISNNVAVIAFQHEMPVLVTAPITDKESFMPVHTDKPTIRKISKMLTYDSSASTNNISSDTTQNQLKTQKRLGTTRLPEHSVRSERQKINSKKEVNKRSRSNLEDWKNKLNILYGPSVTKNKSKPRREAKFFPKKTIVTQSNKRNKLNNSEYIPYSKLTIGGARASDIEKEISGIPNKNSLPLSPILDKILSSRENSFTKTSPRKVKSTNSLKVLTTSDENLLQEVIDIEKTVSETLNKNLKSCASESQQQIVSSESDDTKENESYVDDFEDEKSDRESNNHEDNNNSSDNADVDDNKNSQPQPNSSRANIHNLTYTKISNLSFKNKVDVFEFVHAVDTQDSATQSNGMQKITPSETQTTPREVINVQPIHNNLWPSIDPEDRVANMFELEKEFIKKMIMDEYGEILEKNLSKQSPSVEIGSTTNVSALQKNTQTSPARVKNVMTSPRRTKTRTTSPFTTLTVDKNTSPLVFVSNQDDVKVMIEDEELAMSVDLSSPRFSLRLPKNSREVFSNMEDSLQTTHNKRGKEAGKCNNTETRKSSTDTQINNLNSRKKKGNVNMTTSSSSIEADSSEISSLGEVRLRRMFEQLKITSDCESVCTTSSKYSSDIQSGILPLKSEGEMSLGLQKKSKRQNKSEGETSFSFL